MPDEAPDQIQDTPEEATAPSEQEDKAPEQENAEYFSDSFDPASLPEELVPAYRSMRGDYTKKTQEIGQRNRDQILQRALEDPSFRDQALQAWGVGMEEPDEQDDEYEYYDDSDELRRELAELKEWRDQFTSTQQQQQQEQALYQYVTDELDRLEESLGRELPERVANWIGNVAIQNPNDDGVPDIQGAYDEWVQAVQEDKKTYAKRKRQASKAPSGQSGSQKVDLKDDQARLQALANAAEEADE